MLSAVVLAVAVAAIAFCLWGLAANEITMRQRAGLIAFVYSSWEWRALRAELMRVPYQRHHHAVLTFRDPRRLYAPALHPGFGWASREDLASDAEG